MEAIPDGIPSHSSFPSLKESQLRESLSEKYMSVPFDAAQALLTGLDTAAQRSWRDEDRAWRSEDRHWRKEDLAWREEERNWRHLEQDWRRRQAAWRRADMDQRLVENARQLWSRFVEKNRRDVEEKSEQLKTLSNLSALLAGFAVVSLVEMQFEEKEEMAWLVACFGATTALTVGLMVNAMVTSSLMLASILKNGKTYVAEEEEAEFMARCRSFSVHYKPGDRPPAPKRTFQKHWESRCEDSWQRAFGMFTAGVPCFLANLAFASWLKFDGVATSITITTIMFVSTIVWANTQNTWAWYLIKSRDLERDKLRRDQSVTHVPAGLPFDWHARPRPPYEAILNSTTFDASFSARDANFSSPTPPPTEMNSIGIHRRTPSETPTDEVVDAAAPATESEVVSGVVP